MALTGHSTRIVLTAVLLAAGAPLLAQKGPAPAMTHLDGDVIGLACAPSLTFEQPAPSLLLNARIPYVNDVRARRAS